MSLWPNPSIVFTAAASPNMISPVAPSTPSVFRIASPTFAPVHYTAVSSQYHSGSYRVGKIQLHQASLYKVPLPRLPLATGPRCEGNQHMIVGEEVDKARDFTLSDKEVTKKIIRYVNQSEVAPLHRYCNRGAPFWPLTQRWTWSVGIPNDKCIVRLGLVLLQYHRFSKGIQKHLEKSCAAGSVVFLLIQDHKSWAFRLNRLRSSACSTRQQN